MPQLSKLLPLAALASLPAGAGLPRIAAPQGHRAQGLEVEISEKNTRASCAA